MRVEVNSLEHLYPVAGRLLSVLCKELYSVYMVTCFKCLRIELVQARRSEDAQRWLFRRGWRSVSLRRVLRHRGVPDDFLIASTARLCPDCLRAAGDRKITDVCVEVYAVRYLL